MLGSCYICCSAEARLSLIMVYPLWVCLSQEALLGRVTGSTLVVTSYAMLRRDVGLLTRRAWDYLILDEVG